MPETSREIKLMVSCGSGIATSMVVVVKLKEKFAAEKLKVRIDTCSVNELSDRLGGYDIIVSTAKIPFNTTQAVFNAVPILTGVGEDALIASIIDKVKELANK